MVVQQDFVSFEEFNDVFLLILRNLEFSVENEESYTQIFQFFIKFDYDKELLLGHLKESSIVVLFHKILRFFNITQIDECFQNLECILIKISKYLILLKKHCCLQGGIENFIFIQNLKRNKRFKFLVELFPNKNILSNIPLNPTQTYLLLSNNISQRIEEFLVFII